MLDITAYGSLLIQFITGIIDIFGLYIDVPSNKMIFRDLLKVELIVQSTEFIFYVWMVYNLYKIKNITPYRYIDWFITTPIMLITFMAYLDNKSYNGLYDYIINNESLIIKVVLLNLAMLLFGLLGELKYIPYNIGILLGFIPFVYYFYIIYEKYIEDSSKEDRSKEDSSKEDRSKEDRSKEDSRDRDRDRREDRREDRKGKTSLYWFFLIVWSIYGLAAFAPYIIKNTLYNILDLIAKNGFGLFLVYILWINRIV